MRSLGIHEDRIALTPYCVDNDWWIEQSAKVDRRVVRARWNVPDDYFAILFCAKLQRWKRPLDLLCAFAQIADANAYLVFAGEGPLRSALESKAHSLGIADKVRFLGFRQSIRATGDLHRVGHFGCSLPSTSLSAWL